MTAALVFIASRNNMSIFDGLKKKRTAAKEVQPKEASKPEAAAKIVPPASRRPSTAPMGVLLSPVISEKAAHLAAAHQYVFCVSLAANKVMVKQAVKAAYKVNPVSVNMVRVEGKYVRRGKTSGKQPDYKKAIVTLKPGQTIQLYEGV